MIRCFFLIAFVFLFAFQNINAQSSGIETAGDVGLYSIPAAAILTTIIKGDSKGTWQFAKGFVVNQAITHGLKVTINKPRPYNNGDYSFPSGHTSTTFQAASFIHIRYGFKYSIPAYAFAGFTAFSRIDAQRHDGWDILAGAIIGIGSSYLFTSEFQKKHMELTFSSDELGYLIGYRYNF